MENNQKNNPRISVLMPAYNAEKYISTAMESILRQSFSDFEFIVIDDCSTDETWRIISEYAQKDSRIVPLRNQENLKIAATLNRGIEIARGKYIARMDADDWSYLDRLGKQFKFMERNPKIVISGGTMAVCDQNLNLLNLRKYQKRDQEIREKIFRYSPFCHATTIYKTSEAKKIGGYNEKFFAAQDYDFYFRIGQLGKFANLEDRLYKMRTNPEGISLNRAKNQEKFTLYIRIKAAVEYGYSMSFSDKMYFFFQYLSMFFIPAKIKFQIFNFLRRKEII